MFETFLFKDGRTFIEWAQKNAKASLPADDMVGWPGAIRYCYLAKDFILLYQLEKKEEGLEVCDLHMLLWGAQATLRKNVCRVRKFWRPEGENLWHSAVVFGGRSDTPFTVTNAWQKDAFKTYSEGGNFELTFAGLGTWMESLNERSVIRFRGGNFLEMRRKETNDPTLDYADADLSKLRSLNAGDDLSRPSLAEFTGIVENCRRVKICGVQCYRILLWSGAPCETSSFPWSLLIAADRVEGKFVPRVGDCVHGNAFLFGTFHGEACAAPTVYLGEELFDNGAEQLETCENSASGNEGKAISESSTGKKESEEAVDRKEDWEWLPRKPETYPECTDHGGGLDVSVRAVLPKFVVYGEYRKHLVGELKPAKSPSRRDLFRLLESIDYVITSKNNMHQFADVFDVVGIRHCVKDEVTGERHLWCCLPSGFGREHFHTNLLIALDAQGEVLRYTFHMGALADWLRLDRGMSVEIAFQSANRRQSYASIAEAIPDVAKMIQDDYIIVNELGQTTMLQAYCTKVVNGVPKFTVEWQVHYLPWQFYAKEISVEAFTAMMKEYDRHGIESVETMAQWKWCKMKGNI